jgi:hypothetical protein
VSVIWLYPAAWALAAAVAAPIVIHLLVQRRAERLWFPSLRFVAPSRLASIRRRAIEDWLLLAVRAAILAAAVAAVAGPLVVNTARRASWNARRAVAIVVDDAGADDAQRLDTHGAFATRTFATPDLREGIARAAAWLDTVPPARRELVVASAFARGSIDAEVFNPLPSDIGIRLVRDRALPSSRTLSDLKVWRSAGSVGAAVREHRQRTALDGAVTRVTTGDSAIDGRVPLALAAAPQHQRDAEAALAAVLSQQVPAIPSGRAVTIVFAGAPDRESIARTARDVHGIWMAEAGDHLIHDRQLRRASASASGALEERFLSRPWTPVALSTDGRPVVALAADDAHLLIACAASAASAMAPVLIQSVLNAVGEPNEPVEEEVLPTRDGELRALERPAGAARPRVEAVDSDDRRWFWAAALALLALEWLVRRPIRAADHQQDVEVRARVA